MADQVPKPSDRERDVVQSLINIDLMQDAEVRAVLRHLTTDDAIFSPAQCAHIAKVIEGTLQKGQAEFNALESCGSSSDAVVKWRLVEPSDISQNRLALVANSNPLDSQQGCVQEKARKIEDYAKIFRMDAESDVRDVLRPLHIVNHAKMTVHYHFHDHPVATEHAAGRRETSSTPVDLSITADQAAGKSIPSTAVVPAAPEEVDTEQQQGKHGMSDEPTITTTSKHVLSHEDNQQPPTKRLKPDTSNVAAIAPRQALQPVTQNQPVLPMSQGSLWQQPQDTFPLRAHRCIRCNTWYVDRENVRQSDGKLPCRYHNGQLISYPSGLKKGLPKGVVLYHAWSCCRSGRDSRGCKNAGHKSV